MSLFLAHSEFTKDAVARRHHHCRTGSQCLSYFQCRLDFFHAVASIKIFCQTIAHVVAVIKIGRWINRCGIFRSPSLKTGMKMFSESVE